MIHNMTQTYDVVGGGGGAARLSDALTLARSAAQGAGDRRGAAAQRSGGRCARIS